MKLNFLTQKKTKIFKRFAIATVFLLLCCPSPLLAQLKVGDAGVTFDSSKYDSRYPQMKEWQKAGVQGGIPLRATVAVKKTINPTNSSGINSAINDVANQGGGVLKLNNGKYTINSSVKMKSNVRVVGASKDGVRLVITMGNGDGIDFGKVSKSGLENLTVEGGFGVPNDFEMTEAKKSFFSVSVKMDGGAKNNWIDNCNILNSGRHPLIVAGDYNTVRDCFISRCWNKSSGYQGYVHIKGAHNLVTTTECVYIRHFSMQDSSSEYNVIYGNYTQQEINFHNDDNGNNLVEKNTIRLHKGLKDIWTALMGPWASFHNVSRNDNYLFNNDCIEHNRGNKKPFGGTDKVFVGPNRKQSSERGAEYPFDTTNKVPKGGTFYPIVLGGTPPPPSNVPVQSVSITPSSATLQVGSTRQFSYTISPSNASNKSVTWSSNNNNVASVNNNGVVTAKANGSATITVRTADGNKTSNSNITVNTTPPPTGGCDLPRTLNNITVNKQTVNYSSGPIDISCGSNITIAMTAQGAGSMEDADYLNVYYKVNGGQQIAISENKNSFGSKTISASGINGNTVELIVKGYTSFGDETYTVSNIRISGNGGTPPPPPNPNPTPGGNATLIIEAENFNQTGGTFNDGQAPLGMNKTGIGVNFVNSGDWAEYNINVANSGSYAIMYRISTPSDNAQIQFVLDGNIVATDNVPNNGQWDSYVNLNSSQRVNLSQGNHTIRINASGSNAWQWNMDKITLSRGGNKLITVSEVNVYPNPANQILRLSGVAEYSGINIYDLLGKKVLSQRLKSTEININDLKNGVYMLELVGDSTREIMRIIIKH